MERLASTVVGPDGPLDSKICYIAEAPGEEEDAIGRPLIGSAGQLFDQCLSTTGQKRKDVLVHNVFNQRPPNNKVDYFFQDKSNNFLNWEGEEHVARLKTWLTDLLEMREKGYGGPNVLVAMGKPAMLVLTGKRRIKKWRGSVLPCTLVPGFKVYISHHPSYVNRLMNEPEEKLQGQKKVERNNALPIYLKDLSRAKLQAETPDYTRPERSFRIANSARQAIEWIQALIDKANRNEYISRNIILPTGDVSPGRIIAGGLPVAVDIETLPSSSGPIVWCIGFAESPTEAFCIPIIRNQAFAYSSVEEMHLWRKISEFFLHPAIQKIFHNGLYDMSVLGRYYALRCAEGTYEDTMYGHQMNWPYLLKGLDLCTSIYTWEPYYKDEGKIHLGKRSSDYQEFIYNCRDCCVTREIFPIIRRDAKEMGTDINYETTMYVIPSLIHKHIRGVKIDMRRKGFLTLDYAQKTVDFENRLKALVGRDINLRSSPQINQLLYEELKCKEQYNHKTGKLSADKDAINRLVKLYREPSDLRYQVLSNLREFRKFSKLNDTYTQMEVGRDERIRTSYGWISTFRLNSSESLFGGGGNLQNIPVRTQEGREIRRLFIPDENKEFTACDLAQAEAREVAWLARDTKLINLFLQGWDVHWARAKSIFGFPDNLEYNANAKIRDVYTGEEHTMKFYRNLAKTIVHAGNYRMGPRMLQNILIREGVYLPERTCRELLFSNRKNNPATVAWQMKTIEEVKATRTLITPLGDKRIFRGRLQESLFRSAIAFRPQSTVGRILQIAIQRIHTEMRDVCEVLLNVHDEVIVQNEPQWKDQVMEGIKERIEIPHEVGGMELTIPCDFKTGTSWGDLQEVVL